MFGMEVYCSHGFLSWQPFLTDLASAAILAHRLHLCSISLSPQHSPIVCFHPKQSLQCLSCVKGEVLASSHPKGPFKLGRPVASPPFPPVRILDNYDINDQHTDLSCDWNYACYL